MQPSGKVPFRKGLLGGAIKQALGSILFFGFLWLVSPWNLPDITKRSESSRPPGPQNPVQPDPLPANPNPDSTYPSPAPSRNGAGTSLPPLKIPPAQPAILDNQSSAAPVDHVLAMRIAIIDHDWEKAKGEASAAMRADPVDFEPIPVFAEANLNLGNYAVADEYFAKAVAKQNWELKWLLGRASALAGLGRSKDALSLADQAISLNSQSSEAYRIRARLRRNAGDEHGAEADEETASHLR